MNGGGQIDLHPRKKTPSKRPASLELKLVFLWKQNLKHKKFIICKDNLLDFILYLRLFYI